MLKLALVGAALVAAAAAQAPRPTVSEVPQNTPSYDPNQVVCEVEKDTHSRLKSRRVCRSRAEWAERRSATRHELDRLQGTGPN